jgi:hypothetical protein
MLTFITATASLLRARQWVHILADCTYEDSKCLYDVQRWVYIQFVKGLVKVDIETLELQLSGACDQLAQVNSTTATQFRERVSSIPALSEVRAHPRTISPIQLSSLQRVSGNGCEPTQFEY